MNTGQIPRSSARRRAQHPWLVLTLATLVPALVFGGVFAWAHESITEPEPVVTFADTAGGAPPSPSSVPALSANVLTFRRLASVMARELNVDALAAEVDPTFGLLNERSCAAVSVDGDIVGAHNAELAVIPASNQKLPVAAAALERLGADFRYRTEVLAVAEPIDGVVAGDLVLLGGGDPLLSSDWYPTSELERNPVTSPTSLDELADRVVEAGVVEVTGSVIGDGSRYDDEFFAPSWGPGVAGVDGGPYDALMANDSRVFGDGVRSPDPSEAAAREFSRLLEARGVVIGGPPASGPSPAAGVEIASIESAPMSDVIAEMLLTSDNNTAELVVKELGTIDGEPGTRDAGLAVIRQQLVDWDVDVSSIVLADGSGLSPDNRLTCDALLIVLHRTGFSSAVGQGLPVAGQTGTLSGIFGDHAVSGRLRGKTGTLNNPPFNLDPPAVKALAGFLPVEGGSAVEYALVLNGPTIADQSEYRPVWYAFADALDTYPGAASPAELGPR